MVYIKRKKGETTANLIRRFSLNVNESGILRDVRKAQFYSRKKTRRERQLAALWRNRIRRLRRKLIKAGELGRKEKIDPEILKKYQRELKN